MAGQPRGRGPSVVLTDMCPVLGVGRRSRPRLLPPGPALGELPAPQTGRDLGCQPEGRAARADGAPSAPPACARGPSHVCVFYAALHYPAPARSVCGSPSRETTTLMGENDALSLEVWAGRWLRPALGAPQTDRSLPPKAELQPQAPLWTFPDFRLPRAARSPRAATLPVFTGLSTTET